VNGGPMYTWSDQFDNGITVDMLSTPGGVFVCVGFLGSSRRNSTTTLYSKKDRRLDRYFTLTKGCLSWVF